MCCICIFFITRRRFDDQKRRHFLVYSTDPLFILSTSFFKNIRRPLSMMHIIRYCDFFVEYKIRKPILVINEYVCGASVELAFAYVQHVLVSLVRHFWWGVYWYSSFFRDTSKINSFILLEIQKQTF
jgi:hypothetical protein